MQQTLLMLLALLVYDRTIKEIVNALGDVKSTLYGVNSTLNKIDATLGDMKHE